MFGQITGDPDFDLLRIVVGTDFGLPSPRHTTLMDVGSGNWEVDSFFDITYRIDFVGAVGGTFQGMSGSSTGTTRLQAGLDLDSAIPEAGSQHLGWFALLAPVWVVWRRRSQPAP